MRALAPHTEAQPEAILPQLLVAFGNVIGPGLRLGRVSGNEVGFPDAPRLCGDSRAPRISSHKR